MTNGMPLAPIISAMRAEGLDQAQPTPVSTARFGDDRQPVDQAEIERLTGSVPANSEVDRLAALAAEN